jgi:hypothetical protein
VRSHQLFVADCLRNIDHGTTCLAGKAAAPIAARNPIAHLGGIIAFAEAASPDDDWRALGAQIQDECREQFGLFTANKAQRILERIGPRCFRKIADDAFIGDCTIERTRIFGPTGSQQQSFGSCEHGLSPDLTAAPWNSLVTAL